MALIQRNPQAANDIEAGRTDVPGGPAPTTETPGTAVSASMAFDEDKLYVVKLSKTADYLGSPLAALYNHTVTGKVANAIKDSIATYALAG